MCVFSVCRIDEELQRRVDLGLLVAGKVFDTQQELAVSAGCAFGEEANVPELVNAVKREADYKDEGGQEMVALTDVIVYRARQIPHLPIEDVTNIPSLSTLRAFVDKCEMLDSKQAFHDNALAYSKKEELVLQLIAAMSLLFLSAGQRLVRPTVRPFVRPFVRPPVRTVRSSVGFI